MVTRNAQHTPRASVRGALTTELLVAISVLMLTLFPLALSFLREQKLARAYYWRALAMEIVDGEAEVLAAGAWRAFTPGTHPYEPRPRAAQNLPSGRYELTLATNRFTLEWVPAKPNSGGHVRREVLLR